MNIHHIGYLVKKGPKAQAAFEALGYIAEGEWTHEMCIRDSPYRMEMNIFRG